MPAEAQPAVDQRMCPGRHYGGKPLALCTVKCSRHGGHDMRPMAVVEAGFPSCVHFHGFSVDEAFLAQQAAERGAPESGSACGAAQKALVTA
jgi:hypothetical protein